MQRNDKRSRRLKCPDLVLICTGFKLWDFLATNKTGHGKEKNKTAENIRPRTGNLFYYFLQPPLPFLWYKYIWMPQKHGIFYFKPKLAISYEE